MKSIYLTFLIIIFASFYSLAQEIDSLDFYRQMAVKHNPSVNEKLKSYEASLEKSGQVGSLPDPVFSIGYFVSQAETRVGPQALKLSVSQKFPWFGTLKSNSLQAEFESESKNNILDIEQNKIILSVDLAYYKLYFLRKQIILLKKQTEIIKSIEELSIKNSETNKSDLAQVIELQIVNEEILNKIKIIEDEEKVLVKTFNLILNRDINKKITTDYELDNPILKSIELDSVLNKNPNTAVIGSNIKALEYKLKSDKLSQYPVFSLGLDYVFVNDRTDVVVSESGKDIIMPMLSISLPVYRKKYNSKIKETELLRESLEFKKESIENKIETDLEIYKNDFQKSRHNYILYKSLIEKSEQVLEINSKKYETSNFDYEKILYLQKRIIDYNISLEKARTDMYISISKIESLTTK